MGFWLKREFPQLVRIVATLLFGCSEALSPTVNVSDGVEGLAGILEIMFYYVVSSGSRLAEFIPLRVHNGRPSMSGHSTRRWVDGSAHEAYPVSSYQLSVS